MSTKGNHTTYLVFFQCKRVKPTMNLTVIHTSNIDVNQNRHFSQRCSTTKAIIGGKKTDIHVA